MIIAVLFFLAMFLLTMEAFVPSFGLLGFAGFVSFIAGIVMMLIEGQTEFMGLTLQAVVALGVFIFVGFGAVIYFINETIKVRVSTGLEAMIGQEAEVKLWGKDMGKVTYEGEDWRAQGPNGLKTGDIVIIKAYDKMTLTVVRRDDGTDNEGN